MILRVELCMFDVDGRAYYVAKFLARRSSKTREQTMQVQWSVNSDNVPQKFAHCVSDFMERLGPHVVDCRNGSGLSGALPMENPVFKKFLKVASCNHDFARGLL